MPGLVPGIHDFFDAVKKDVDGRDKPGHDADGNYFAARSQAMTSAALWSGGKTG